MTLYSLHGNRGFIDRNRLLRLWSIKGDYNITSADQLNELTINSLLKKNYYRDGENLTILSYLSTPADSFSMKSLRMSDKSVKFNVCLLL